MPQLTRTGVACCLLWIPRALRGGESEQVRCGRTPSSARDSVRRRPTSRAKGLRASPACQGSKALPARSLSPPRGSIPRSPASQAPPRPRGLNEARRRRSQVGRGGSTGHAGLHKEAAPRWRPRRKGGHQARATRWAEGADGWSWILGGAGRAHRAAVAQATRAGQRATPWRRGRKAGLAE